MRHAVKGDFRRVTWLYGTQQILIEEIIETMRGCLATSAETDFVSLTAGMTPDKEIWAIARQLPLNPRAKRLVLIRSAEKLQSFSALEHWLRMDRRRTSSVHIVLVWGLAQLPGERQSRKLIQPSYLELIRSKGFVVRCSYPNPDDLLVWMNRHVKISWQSAQVLAQRSGGSLRLMRDVCDKIACFDREITPRVIEALCRHTPGEEFTELVLLGNKALALRTLEELGDAEVSRTIGLLDSRLDTLATLHHAAGQGWRFGEATARTGVPQFLVKKYWDLSRSYTPVTVLRRRGLLALIDGRRSSWTGALEVLTVLW
jgi:DNA polymerase III delta subunit